MTWVKRLGPLAGTDGGWRDDLPLAPELPQVLVGPEGLTVATVCLKR